MLENKNTSLHEEGPVISVEVESPAGTPRRVFVRNPFAPPGEGRDWRSTADYWFHSGFNRGEIGPDWN